MNDIQHVLGFLRLFGEGDKIPNFIDRKMRRTETGDYLFRITLPNDYSKNRKISVFGYDEGVEMGFRAKATLEIEYGYVLSHVVSNGCENYDQFEEDWNSAIVPEVIDFIEWIGEIK